MFTVQLFIYAGQTVVIIYFITVSFTPTRGQEVIMSTPCDDICDLRRDAADCEGRMFETIEEVHECHGVSSLDVGYNLIPEIRNDSLSGFHELVYLDLSSNPITYIAPGSFHNIPQLETLVLSRIRVHRLLNGTFEGLQRLRKINFWAGKLQVLEPASLAGLRSVREITFSLNKIERLPEMLFSGSRNLEIISFSVNKIRNLPSGIFSDLNHLRVIELVSNRLTSIADDLFSGLPALEKVDLRKNNLIEIPPINVNYLDLSYNQLTHVPVPRDDIKWKTVYLHRNQLHCNYRIEPLRRWYACQVNASCDIGTAKVDHWRCATPDEHYNMKISDLSPAVITTTERTTTIQALEKTSPSNFDKQGNKNMMGSKFHPSSSREIMSSVMLTTFLNVICLFVT